MEVNSMLKKSIDAPTPHSDGRMLVTLSGIVSDTALSDWNLIPVYRESQALRGPIVRISPYLQLLALVCNCAAQYCFTILIFKDRWTDRLIRI